MPLYGMHDQRDRAESFGSFAEEYDESRPGYPEELIEDLSAAGPRTVLDIACGTGKAAVPFLARGPTVLGIEPDPTMAAVARRHGVRIEVTRFEDWDPRGRRFDLITCGHAWHWLDPTAKDRIPGLLRQGGIIARFWNYHVFDSEVVVALDDAYVGVAPNVHRFGRDLSGEPEPPDPLRDVPGLTVLPSRTYRWSEQLTADQWTRRIATFSDHQQLGPKRLAELQDRVARVFGQFGGSVRAQNGTLCLLAQRS
jgi:SAM-dependent methyltransferase